MRGFGKHLTAIYSLLIAACNYGSNTPPDPDAGGSGGGAQDCGQRSEVENPCLSYGMIADVDVKKIDKVDLLFVIDNSGSMQRDKGTRLAFSLFFRSRKSYRSQARKETDSVF